MKNVLPVLLVLAAAGQADAKLKTQDIEYTDNGTELQGYLVYDDASSAKRPGVLVVHEWWGLNDYARRRAEQLAELGYVAFAVDMYGKGKVTEHPAQAREWATQVRQNVEEWQKRAVVGLEILQEHELVDRRQIAAIGYCFGGATVLELAYGGADLAGVVSFHGALPVPTEEQRNQIKSKILVCHGAADPFLPADQLAEFRSALEDAGADWQMVYYSGARHSFTNPAADTHGIEGIKYDEKADKRSWQDMQQFFDEIFRERT